MRSGSKLFIIAGVGLALVALALIALTVTGGGSGQADAQKEEEVNKVAVVQAVVDLPAHTILQAEDLIVKEVPEPEADPDAARNLSDVLGLSYRVPLVKGQTLLMAQTEQPGLKNDIAKGKRAFSLPADDRSLLSGLIQDADYIDVVFDARINEVRILPGLTAELPEDAAYYEFQSMGGGSPSDASGEGNNNDDENADEQSGLGSVVFESIEEAADSDGVLPELAPPGIGWLPAGWEFPMLPPTGEPGSKMYIRDDIKEEQQLEPVAKVLVQDVRVLRVVRPGERFAANGQPAEPALADEGVSSSTEETGGYLILEVTPEQAEVLSFMQDRRHEYQVMVRGKDDHETVSTTGITFYVLVDDYAMPLPRPVELPEEQKKPARSTGNGSAAADQAEDTETEEAPTGAAEATPEAGSGADGTPPAGEAGQ